MTEKWENRWDRMLCAAGCALLIGAFLAINFSVQRKNTDIQEPADTPNPQFSAQPSLDAAPAVKLQSPAFSPAPTLSVQAAMLLPPTDGAVVRGFSDLPTDTGLDGWYLPHDGVDFSAQNGQEVCAPMAGTVAFCGKNAVQIHAQDRIVFLSGLGTLMCTQGQQVRAGDVIALAGTGACEGVHLSMLEAGKLVDPAQYLP